MGKSGDYIIPVLLRPPVQPRVVEFSAAVIQLRMENVPGMAGNCAEVGKGFRGKRAKKH